MGETDPSTLYSEIIDELFVHYQSNERERKKIIVERVKQRIEWESKNILNTVKNPTKSIADLKADILGALNISNWSFSPEDHFDEEHNRIEKIIAEKDIKEFIKIFPGKSIFGIIASKLGITKDRIHSLIIAGLNDSKHPMHEGLNLVLAEYLPSR